MTDWLNLALRPDIMHRAVKVALVVGSLLVAINQGDVILNGEISLTVMAKILLTYCVPYGVSTYAGVAAIADQRDGMSWNWSYRSSTGGDWRWLRAREHFPRQTDLIDDL